VDSEPKSDQTVIKEMMTKGKMEQLKDYQISKRNLMRIKSFLDNEICLDHQFTVPVFRE